MPNAGAIFLDVFDELRPKGDRWRGCILGDFEGNLDAPLAGWKYVRIPIAGSGNYALGMFPGQNVSGSSVNTPVIIEYDPLNNQRVIVGPDVQALGVIPPGGGGSVPDPGSYSVPLHAWTHQLGGTDQVDVANEQLTNLQLRPASPVSSHVVVKGGVYVVGSYLVKLQADVDVDLTPYFPGSGVKYVWITMTNAGTAVVIDDGITSIAALTLPVTSYHLVGFVMLQFGQPIRWTSIKNTQTALGGNPAWLSRGNDGVDSTVDWMGSVNDDDVVFKQHGIEVFRMTGYGIDSQKRIRSYTPGAAGIQIDPNGATGNHDLSLSPANLTGDRRMTLPDYDLVWPAADAVGYLHSDGAGALAWAAGGGHTIQDEGTPLPARANLNFVGAGVTATDDAGDNATIVTIPGRATDRINFPIVTVQPPSLVEGDTWILKPGAGADEVFPGLPWVPTGPDFYLQSYINGAVRSMTYT